MVYELYGLTEEEIAVVEGRQINRQAFAISIISREAPCCFSIIKGQSSLEEGSLVAGCPVPCLRNPTCPGFSGVSLRYHAAHDTRFSMVATARRS